MEHKARQMAKMKYKWIWTQLPLRRQKKWFQASQKHFKGLAWLFSGWDFTFQTGGCGFDSCAGLGRVWLFMTPYTATYQAPLSLGILQARILEWVAMPSYRSSSQPRDQTQVSRIVGGFFTDWATRDTQDYWS